MGETIFPTYPINLRSLVGIGGGAGGGKAAKICHTFSEQGSLSEENFQFLRSKMIKQAIHNELTPEERSSFCPKGQQCGWVKSPGWVWKGREVD